MNIAYLSTFYPLRGGIAQFNASLFREFEKENSIKAFTFTRQYPKIFFPGSSQYVLENDSADEIPSIECLDTINPLTYLSTAYKIKQFKPELMLTKFWMPFFGPSLGWVALSLKKQGITNISILDNIKPHEPKKGDIAITKFFLKQNHGFIVMSDTVKNDLLKLMPEARYSFNPHPLYNHFGSRRPQELARKRLNIENNKKVLLFFGFIRSYKGLDILLEAMQFLPEDYLLLIAGEMYGDFKIYEELIQKYDISHKVQLFVRYISDLEVPDFFSASDVCILPYKSATQSGIVGISYNFGLPVIATDTGGLREMIEPYQTGILVSEPKQNLLSAAISDYFKLDLRDRLESNIERYKEAASWEKLAKCIIELYNEIKNQKK